MLGAGNTHAEACPKSFYCPITCTVMADPVQTVDGHCYERHAITDWLQGHDTSPLTNAELASKTLTPCHALRSAIEEFFQASAKKQRYHIPAAELSIEEEVGSGAFKTVHRGKWRDRRVAVLVMNKGAESATEAEVFARLGRRPGLLSFYGKSEDSKGRDCIVTDFAPYGSLLRCIHALADLGCTPDTHVVLTIARQIVQGMENLVHEGFIHRDLSARNVLCFNISTSVPSEVDVRVADYGLTREGLSYYGGDDKLPFRWMAPEALERRRWSEKSDVWAFGVTLWEILECGKLPYFEISDRDAVVREVLAGKLLPKPDVCPEEVWLLIQSCWAKLPKDRPTFKTLSTQLAEIEQRLFGPPPEELSGNAEAGAASMVPKKVDVARVVATRTTLDLLVNCFPPHLQPPLRLDLHSVIPVFGMEREHTQRPAVKVEQQGLATTARKESKATESSVAAEGADAGAVLKSLQEQLEQEERPTFEQFADQCILAFSVLARCMTIQREEGAGSDRSLTAKLKECELRLEKATLDRNEMQKSLREAERRCREAELSAATSKAQAEAERQRAEDARRRAEESRFQSSAAFGSSDFRRGSSSGSSGTRFGRGESIQGVCETTGAPCRVCSGGNPCDWAFTGRPGHFN